MFIWVKWYVLIWRCEISDNVVNYLNWVCVYGWYGWFWYLLCELSYKLKWRIVYVLFWWWYVKFYWLF